MSTTTACCLSSCPEQVPVTVNNVTLVLGDDDFRLVQESFDGVGPFTLSHTPVAGYQETVFVNGRGLSEDEYSIAGTALTINGLDSGDHVMITYAYEVT